MQLITTLSVALLLVASVIAQATINTSGNPTFGQPFQFSWSGGQAPFFPSIIPAGQVSATPLQTFPQTNDNSFSFVWNTIPAGTAVNLAIRDGSGAQSFSGQLTVLPGSGTASSASGSSAATGASTASTPASSGASSAATSSASSVSASSAASPSSIAITRSATPSASGTSARPTSASPASATPSPSPGAASNVKVASGLMAAAGLIAVALA